MDVISNKITQLNSKKNTPAYKKDGLIFGSAKGNCSLLTYIYIQAHTIKLYY